MLADLVGHGPLMPLFIRLGPKVDLPFPGRTLGPSALKLTLVKADDHSEVSLSESDGVNRRCTDPGGAKQLDDATIDLKQQIVSCKVGHHGV